MDVTPELEGDKLFLRALEALASGETPAALALLERAIKKGDNQSWHSYLGFCLAKERGQFKAGSDLCLGAIKREPDNPVHYLNLAKVHLIAGQKPDALRVLRQGMAAGGNPEIVELLDQLGNRKPPVVTFLAREHALNKYLGRLLHRLGMR